MARSRVAHSSAVGSLNHGIGFQSRHHPCQQLGQPGCQRGGVAPMPDSGCGRCGHLPLMNSVHSSTHLSYKLWGFYQCLPIHEGTFPCPLAPQHEGLTCNGRFYKWKHRDIKRHRLLYPRARCTLRTKNVFLRNKPIFE